MQAAFPHLVRWQSVSFRMVGQSLDPQQGISGAETIVPTLRGRWTASATMWAHGEAAVLQWQAFLAQMQGRIGATVVPAFSHHRPKDRDGHEVGFAGVANIAHVQTMDHFGFANPPLDMIRVNQNAAPRATEIELRYPNSSGLRPGHFFSIGERLYQVQAVYKSRDTEFGPRYAVHFQPPLRAPVLAGDLVEVARPVCRMRFASEDEGQFEQTIGGVLRATVNFVEVM